MQQNKLGSLQIIIASICFGALPLLTRIGYAGGANAVTLLAVRFSVASVLIWAYLFLTKTEIKVNLKQVAVFALVAVLGYGVMAYSYFNSFHYIPSAMSAMIMFIYPVIVTYLAAVLLKRPITRAKVFALLLVTTGAIMMSAGEIAFNLIGIGLALTSAFTYAFYILYLGSKYTFEQEPKVLTAFIILFAAIFFTGLGVVQGQLTFEMSTSAWVAVIVMAVFSTVVAIMVFYAGVQKIGPATAAIISTVEPLTALVFGLAILGETMGALQWVGALFILAGVTYVQIPAPKPKINWKARV